MKNMSETTRHVRAMTDFDLTTLVHTLPGMAYRCQWNRSWAMEFVSLGCQALTGYSCEELVGDATEPWHSLVHPEDMENVLDGIRAAITDEKPYQLAYRIVTREGLERWIQEDGRSVSMPGRTDLPGRLRLRYHRSQTRLSTN
jgi:PAS domain-containing protein